MSDFLYEVEKIVHKIVVKFTRAFLPEAKKPYYLKPVHQKVYGIRDLSALGVEHNIGVDARTVEEGGGAMLKLIERVVLGGGIVKTKQFIIRLRIPGEYDGSETHLHEGMYPVVRMHPTASFQKKARENIVFEFDGIDEAEGLIAEATDEATGLVDDCATMGNVLTVHGTGLKIEADDVNKSNVGLFFVRKADETVKKAELIAINEPKTIKTVVPASLEAGAEYFLQVVTQSSAKHGSGLLKETREVRSEFTLTAHT